MTVNHSTDNVFIQKLIRIVEVNLADENFGVKELAEIAGMSRSQIHRKLRPFNNQSVSQFIREVRLKKAMELLHSDFGTISEITYKVGFSSPSYFTKCFHDYFGYAPGDYKKYVVENNHDLILPVQSANKKSTTILVLVVLVAVTAGVLFGIFKPFPFQQNKLENTFAILPPYYNEKLKDSTALDGILQEVRDNLCKINDIEKVVPWISVLQYRSSLEPASQIALKLKVNYVIKPKILSVEGRVYLSLSLIEGLEDKLLETFAYEIDSNNIATVHLEIINEIADKLNIPISRTEQDNIDELIASNKKARKQYWQGVEIINRWYTGKKSDIEAAKTCFENAIKYDNECASAYAQLAFVYYLMDYHWMDQHIPEHEILYGSEINKYADEAMYYDSQLDLSLFAKALYYLNEKEYELAIRYLEDARSYNPKSYLIMTYLCHIYGVTEDSEKHIEYALKMVDINFPEMVNNRDFGKASNYLRLGSSYRDLGFFKEALKYHNMAIDVNPDYLAAINSKSQVICDLEEDDNYQQSIDLLLNLIKNDSTILGYYFLGLSYYMLRDYQKAHDIYNKWFELSGNSIEDYSGLASGRLAVVYREVGEPKKAQLQINNYRDYAESGLESRNRSYRLIGYYSFIGDTTKALEHLKIASKYDHYYVRIRMLKDAPIYDNIRELPHFQQILAKMQTRWQERHDSIKAVFNRKELL